MRIQRDLLGKKTFNKKYTERITISNLNFNNRFVNHYFLRAYFQVINHTHTHTHTHTQTFNYLII